MTSYLQTLQLSKNLSCPLAPPTSLYQSSLQMTNSRCRCERRVTKKCCMCQNLLAKTWRKPVDGFLCCMFVFLIHQQSEKSQWNLKGDADCSRRVSTICKSKQTDLCYIVASLTVKCITSYCIILYHIEPLDALKGYFKLCITCWDVSYPTVLKVIARVRSSRLTPWRLSVTCMTEKPSQTYSSPLHSSPERCQTWR